MTSPLRRRPKTARRTRGQERQTKRTRRDGPRAVRPAARIRNRLWRSLREALRSHLPRQGKAGFGPRWKDRPRQWRTCGSPTMRPGVCRPRRKGKRSRRAEHVANRPPPVPPAAFRPPLGLPNRSRRRCLLGPCRRQLAKRPGPPPLCRQIARGLPRPVWSQPPLFRRLCSRSAPARQPFKSGWQVDQFTWPRLCRRLIARAAGELDRLADALLAANSQGQKVLAVAGCRRGEGATTLLLSPPVGWPSVESSRCWSTPISFSLDWPSVWACNRSSVGMRRKRKVGRSIRRLSRPRPTTWPCCRSASRRPSSTGPAAIWPACPPASTF